MGMTNSARVARATSAVSTAVWMLAAGLVCAVPAAAVPQDVPPPRVAGTPAAGAQSPAPPAAQADRLPATVRGGSPDGPAQFTVFCDVSDDACRRLVVVFAGVLDDFPAQAGVEFRHHAPKDQEPAHQAYRAVLAAARQGRGWRMLDLVCANGDRLDDAGLRSMAAQLGLDPARFSADAESTESYVVADQDARQAADLKLDAAPAVFLNSTRLAGPYTLDSLSAAIKGIGR